MAGKRIAMAGALVALMLPAVAQAGTYDVVSCGAPGAGGVNHSLDRREDLFRSGTPGGGQRGPTSSTRPARAGSSRQQPVARHRAVADRRAAGGSPRRRARRSRTWSAGASASRRTPRRRQSRHDAAGRGRSLAGLPVRPHGAAGRRAGRRRDLRARPRRRSLPGRRGGRGAVGAERAHEHAELAGLVCRRDRRRLPDVGRRSAGDDDGLRDPGHADRQQRAERDARGAAVLRRLAQAVGCRHLQRDRQLGHPHRDVDRRAGDGAPTRVPATSPTRCRAPTPTAARWPSPPPRRTAATRARLTVTDAAGNPQSVEQAGADRRQRADRQPQAPPARHRDRRRRRPLLRPRRAARSRSATARPSRTGRWPRSTARAR